MSAKTLLPYFTGAMRWYPVEGYGEDGPTKAVKGPGGAKITANGSGEGAGGNVQPLHAALSDG